MTGCMLKSYNHKRTTFKICELIAWKQTTLTASLDLCWPADAHNHVALHCFVSLQMSLYTNKALLIKTDTTFNADIIH